MNWWDALARAGVVPASYTPPLRSGRGWTADPDDGGRSDAELLEDATVQRYAVTPPAGIRPACFLDGLQKWKVVGYDGVTPVVRAFVAGAARRRGPSDRTLKTVVERAREFALAPLAAMAPERRRALESLCPDVVDLPDAAGQAPPAVLEIARRRVDAARQKIEREVAEQTLDILGSEEWLLVDGPLSVSRKLAGHPRAVGLITSHGAQYFDGENLERALTVPAGHRTSVFRATGGHARNEVYSWYQRLWPWEGRDVLYGLVRIEARADPETVSQASAIAGWLSAERAPLADPLYPLQNVELYLQTRAPRDLTRRA